MMTLAVIAALILLNALFVGAEFALVGVPRAAIERKAMKGHGTARRISLILHDPKLQDRYFATAQLGITLASLGLGMYGEHMLAQGIGGWMETLPLPHWLAVHALDTFLAVTVLTYFHVVLGEMVPKSIALRHAERTALLVLPFMSWVRKVLYPFVYLVNGIGAAVLRGLGVSRQITVGHYLTPAELQYIVSESQEGAHSGRIGPRAEGPPGIWRAHGGRGHGAPGAHPGHSTPRVHGRDQADPERIGPQPLPRV